MKIIIFCVMVYLVAGCNTSSNNKLDMRGAYFMNSQTLNDGKKDTKYTDLKQLKIYTDSMMMYVQVNPSDSASAFGVGKYTTGNGTVTENVIYSARDTSFTSSPASFHLIITKTPDGYTQVIPQIVTDTIKYRLTEVYQKVTTNTTTSPLDGVWKEVQSYVVQPNKKDTIKNVRIQYKAFYNGYFMFGHTFTDSASKHHTGIGFGTFEMANNNMLKETDINSTYSIIAGNTFDVAVSITGKDNYRQIISYPDSSKSYEFYERLRP
jgi:hypothetical protein